MSRIRSPSSRSASRQRASTSRSAASSNGARALGRTGLDVQEARAYVQELAALEQALGLGRPTARSVAVKPGGTNTPNCQRTWFFTAPAR